MASYNICVPEDETVRFMNIVDMIYNNKKLVFSYVPVSYKLKSTLEYQISFNIICSEETLKKIIEFSGISNIVAICTHFIEYKEMRYYYESGVGRTLIQNTACSHHDLYKLSLNYPSYVNGFTYTILYDNTYKKWFLYK